MKATTDIRSVFLKMFMREIFANIKQEERVLSSEIKRIESPQFTASLHNEKKVDFTPSARNEILPAPSIQKSKFPSSSAAQRMPLPYNVPPILLRQRPPTPKVYLAPPTESWLVNLQSLKRIQPLLNDKTITSIECSGPGMPIMIARGSYVQSTPVHFTVDEINKIIQEISAHTKIPLNSSGIFKAAIGEIIITAVLSEFVGTRFIIQKKIKNIKSPPAPLRR